MGSRPSPAPSSSSEVEGSARDASSASAAPSGGSGGPSTRNFKATQAASVAAVVESASAHRAAIPGLAELLGGSGGVGMAGGAPYFKGGGGGGGGSSSSEGLHTHMMSAGGDGDNAGGATESEAAAVAGHPSLPSRESVSAAVSKLINECAPFVTMSARDSAPQLRLEDPPPVVRVVRGLDGVVRSIPSNTGGVNFQRRLVVKGGMKGYRMSRATHGAASGCYYYEAVILGGSESGDGGGSDAPHRGAKRSLQEMEGTATEPKSNGGNGHLRIGWSTRNADLQAPVGYNEHSYGVRDTLGSRIHKSRREDRWGGVGFGPGDVVGLAICLVESKAPSNTATSTSLGSAAVGMEDAESKRNENGQVSGEGAAKSPSALTNHIRFFMNGRPMGNGAAFDGILPGTYYPSVSCYMDGAARLNFGPHFIFPPRGLPPEVNLRPVSELCESPALPDEVVERVISGGGGKESKKAFFPKRTNDGIVSAFKELARMEATVRHEAYSSHLDLHRREIAALQRDRGLSTLDLEGGPPPRSW